jgi:RND family efflux transporter MFP subunit
VKRALLILAVLGAGFAGGMFFREWRGGKSGAVAEQGGRKILYWHDPMHPAYRSDKPGIAPDCGMRLEPVYADKGQGAAKPDPNRKILHYRDPQDPKYTSDKPGLNPETGNDLEPVYEGDAASMPPGTVQISAEKQQLIGVTYGTAEYHTHTQQVRAVGRVAIDETRIAHVHTRVEGWVERVFVDYTGELVKQGQPMLTIYSPEMLASQQELLLALRAREILKGSSVRGVEDDNRSLVEAARRRLELWGLSGEQIEEIQRTGKPLATITVHAPITGYVTSRNAFLKQKITPETELYTLVDLSRVWIMADVFEADASQVRVGQSATVTMSYDPARRFTAKVTYIQPQVDPQTRTLKVRLELANPDGALKPEMFANVDFHGIAKPRLVVPANAVLNSGLRQTVFVDRGNGFLEPRQVETGERFGDRVEIASGLRPGERIATSGVFLIDSESQLKSGMGGGAVSQPGEAPAAETAPAKGGHQHD